MTFQRMRPIFAACILGLSALVAACDDEDSTGSTTAGGKPGSGGSGTSGGRNGTGGVSSGGVPNAGGARADSAGASGSGETPLVHCLDRPDLLPQPPAGQLPCELLPPGFGE